VKRERGMRIEKIVGEGVKRDLRRRAELGISLKLWEILPGDLVKLYFGGMSKNRLISVTFEVVEPAVIRDSRTSSPALAKVFEDEIPYSYKQQTSLETSLLRGRDVALVGACTSNPYLDELYSNPRFHYAIPGRHFLWVVVSGDQQLEVVFPDKLLSWELI